MPCERVLSAELSCCAETVGTCVSSPAFESSAAITGLESINTARANTRNAVFAGANCSRPALGVLMGAFAPPIDLTLKELGSIPAVSRAPAPGPPRGLPRPPAPAPS